MHPVDGSHAALAQRLPHLPRSHAGAGFQRGRTVLPRVLPVDQGVEEPRALRRRQEGQDLVGDGIGAGSGANPRLLIPLGLVVGLPGQPGPGQRPVPLHGGWRDPQRLRRVGHPQPPEDPAFHHPGVPRLQGLQALQDLVHPEDVSRPLPGGGHHVVDGHVGRTGPPLLRPPHEGVVHQDAPHGLGAHPEEVGAVPPGEPLHPGELQVRLVDQRRGVQGVTRALDAQGVVRQAV